MNRFKIFIIVLGALFLVACNSDSSSDSPLDKSIKELNDPDKKEQDVTPPVISLNGEARVEINQGETYTDAGATAMDNVDGLVAVTASGVVDTSQVGTYTITFTAVDSAGNLAAEVTRTVNVLERLLETPEPDTGTGINACETLFCNPESGTIPYYSNIDSLATGRAEMTQAIIVIHGTDRNAQDYYNTIKTLADSLEQSPHTLIVAPHFQADTDTAQANEYQWSSFGWKQGNKSIEKEGLERVSSFAVLDDLVLTLADSTLYPNLQDIVITGHSAGGQFTQRYAVGNLLSEQVQSKLRYVVANPGSYMYLDATRPDDADPKLFTQPDTTCAYDDYKYGMSNRSDTAYMNTESADTLTSNYLTRRVTYLLGSADTVIDEDLDTDCEANLQGENRYQRGLNYFSYLQSQFPNHQHQKIEVMDAGHSRTAMYSSTVGQHQLFPALNAETPIWHWDFEQTQQAWSVTTGSATTSLTTGYNSDQALSISTRQNAYEGLGVVLTDQLEPDQTYVVRAWVKKSFANTDGISLSLQVGTHPSAEYRQLNRVVVEGEDWHLMRAFIRLNAEETDQFLRLFINTDDELGGFAIDEITLSKVNPLTDSLPALSLDGAQLKQGEQDFRLQSINLIAYHDYDVEDGITPADFTLNDYFKQTYNQFDRDDFERIKQLGFNGVRLALDGRWFEDINQPGRYLTSGFAWLDFVLSWAEQAGIYVILDMHAPIGGGFQGPQTVREFWDEPTDDNNDYRARLIALWQEITERYKDRSVIAAFDVLNEPKPYNQAQYEDWLDDLIPAIAAIDPNRLLIIENTFAHDMTFVVRTEPNVIHDYHFYDPWDAFTDDPAAVWGEDDLNLERVRADFAELIEAYQGKAVHIGEFGQEYANFTAKNAEGWLNDVKTVMDENGFHYAYFAYKGNVFGLYASEQRFAVNATVNQDLYDWLLDANSRLFEAPQTEEPEPPGLVVNELDSKTYDPITTTPLDYLNSLRGYAGLTHYTENSQLATAAMGHTDYQLNLNVMGHFQTQGQPGFTGVTAGDRAEAAGYNSWAVSENISFNKDTANELIDDLMTAIYHRMSLLDFERDEIGFGFKVQPVPDKENDLVWGVLTTKSGLMALETLCTAGETITSGSYYTCPNNNRVSVESYNLALANVRANSNEFIVWPAPGSIVPPVFYEEDPDPLPECSVSGNPISVQINPKNLADYTLLADSFVLKDSQGQAVEILTTLTNETAQPDIAAASWQTDDKKWLSAFPAERLTWGETYTASLNYTYGGVTETWQWSFSTQSLPQTPMQLNADTSKTMQQNEVLYVYVPPQDCSVSQNGWATSSSYFDGDNPQVSVETIDSQTYKIQASSLSELKIEFRQQGNSVNTRTLTLTYD